MIDGFLDTCSLIADLAQNDFSSKYAGSFLGRIWAFIQPLVLIVIYWIVFQYGLRIKMNDESVPYVIWFMTGMVPWLFFSECLGAGSNCLKEYDYLVKNVVFPIYILPIIKVISSLFAHFVYIGVLAVLFAWYNIFLGIHLFEFVYYLLALCIYSCAWVLMSSTIVVFFKDFGQIITIIMQVGMWATPIVWDYHIVPVSSRWIIECNPMFYIVNGYRTALFGNTGIRFLSFQFCFFWIFTLAFLGVAIIMFCRLKPHFADVL